jgi:Brp/Blh family beta-carotene 15,15'-monooxygenase
VNQSELSLMQNLRTLSRLCATAGILVALFFGPFEGIPIELQVGIALAALAIGIPHGAVDHLITLPSLTATQRIAFIASYLAVVGLVIWAILSANVLGFQLVVLMSAIHFGLGDAAFVSELNARKSDNRPFPKLPFAIASGFTPVVIPLVSAQSTQALEAVNPNLVGWAMGFAPVLFIAMTTVSVGAIIWMLFVKSYQEAIDLGLLLTLSLVAPPLLAFAIYFGLWHAMRHTVRVSLELRKSQIAHEQGKPARAFSQAVLAGIPALILVLGFVVYLTLTRGTDLSTELLWYGLVVVWALTVPHMLLTLRLDVKALGSSASHND